MGRGANPFAGSVPRHGNFRDVLCCGTQAFSKGPAPHIETTRASGCKRQRRPLCGRSLMPRTLNGREAVITAIRLASESDSEAISQLTRGLSERFIAHEFSEEGRMNLLSSMTTELTRQRIRDGFRYHVYEEDGALLGVAATRDNAHLYHLFVAEPAQRRGLARRLYEAARQACLDAGGPKSFTVNASRFAAPMYERFGFVRESEEINKGGVIFIPMVLRDPQMPKDAVQPGLAADEAHNDAG